MIVDTEEWDKPCTLVVLKNSNRVETSHLCVCACVCMCLIESIVEYLKLEGTHNDHRVQFPTIHIYTYTHIHVCGYM